MTHEPYLIEAPLADTLVLLIHGITGSPHQFDALARHLYAEGISVQSLLLPGHGSTAKAFAQSGRLEWERSVNRAVRHALLRYKNVVLVGHSMGCLLAINAYHTLPEKHAIRGLVLLAPPLRIHLTSECIRKNLKSAISRQAEEAAGEAYNSVEKGRALGYVRWLPRYMDVLKMASKARRQIEGLRVPILAVHSQGDEIVSIKSVQELQRRLPETQVLMLPHSTHFLYTEEDAKLLREQAAAFIGWCTAQTDA